MYLHSVVLFFFSYSFVDNNNWCISWRSDSSSGLYIYHHMHMWMLQKEEIKYIVFTIVVVVIILAVVLIRDCTVSDNFITDLEER